MSFANCKYLQIYFSSTSLDINLARFVHVGKRAFYNSPKSFTFIQFSNDLADIDEEAFSGVTSLTKITYCGNYNIKCSFNAFDEMFSSEVLVDENYVGGAFCGINVKRAYGNPCIPPTAKGYEPSTKISMRCAIHYLADDDV